MSVDPNLIFAILALELGYLADEQVLAHQEPGTVRMRRWLRKHPKSVAALAATMLVGLTSLAAIVIVVSGKNKMLATANVAERNARDEANRKRIDAENARLKEEQARQRAEAVTKYMVKAFLSDEPRLDAKSITVAEALDDLASVYDGAGQVDLALPLYEEALRIREARLGPAHSDTLTSMTNLAMAYEAIGKLDLAVPLYVEALQSNRELLGPEHVDTILAMARLASVYISLAKLDSARTLYEEALPQLRAKLGPEHTETLKALNALGFVQMEADKLDSALLFHEEALKLSEASLGVSHGYTLTSMNNLARLYVRRKQFDRAVAIIEKCLANSKADFSDTWFIFDSQTVLGAALAGQEKFADAETLIIEGYEQMEARAETIPVFHRSRLLEAILRLVDLYTVWGKPEEAAKWQKQLDLRKQMEPMKLE